MSEVFKVFMQDGYFKILDVKERERFKNYCIRYKGRYAQIEISTGLSIQIDEDGNITEEK